LEKKMKITLNVVLAVVLFCSAAFAGDMGNGGRPSSQPTNTTTTTVDTVIAAVIQQLQILGF
jgi:hypothetical protein